MPIRKIVYVCPFCQEAFDDEWEAEDHLSTHEIEMKIVFECEGCNYRFDTLSAAVRHELECLSIPDTCENCNNYEEGKRHFPCERPYYDMDMSPCAIYQRAKVAP